MFHWFLVHNILKLFGKNRPFPIIKKPSLTNRHSFLQSKSIFFTFLMLVVFTGGFLYNYFVADPSQKSVAEMTTVKQYLSKVTLATLFLLLNFFINELHLFAYNPSEVYKHIPNNPNFYIFLFAVLALYIGLLTLNSKFVPEKYHLNVKFYDSSGIGGKIGASLLAVNAFWCFMNIVMNFNSVISNILLLGFSMTSLILNKKIINVWIIYGILTLFMINNMRYVNNINIGQGWIMMHYFFYAFQLAMFFFSLIKLEDFNFFEAAN